MDEEIDNLLAPEPEEATESALPLGDDEADVPAAGASEAQYAAPAGAGEAPAFIPYHPAMNAQQRRMIDMLNTRRFNEYRQDVMEQRRVANQRAVMERQEAGRNFRAQQSEVQEQRRQSAAEKRNKERIDAANRLQAQRVHEARMKDDPEYRRNFEMRSLDEREREIEQTYAGGAPINLEPRRRGIETERLDIGAQYADRARGRRKTDDTEFGTEGTTFENPTKVKTPVEASGRVKPFVQAYKDMLDERKIDPKSGKADEKAANFRVLDKGERREFFDLTERIGQRGFNDRSPDLLTRAIYNIAYNPQMPVSVRRDGLLQVGDTTLAVNRDEYIQLMTIRGKEAQRLEAKMKESESRAAAKSAAESYDMGTRGGAGPTPLGTTTTTRLGLSSRRPAALPLGE